MLSTSTMTSGRTVRGSSTSPAAGLALGHGRGSGTADVIVFKKIAPMLPKPSHERGGSIFRRVRYKSL